MERINVQKNSRLKVLLLDALKHQEYVLITKTNTAFPTAVYFQEQTGNIAIYSCKPDHDEFITLDGDKPAKINVIIQEFQRADSPNSIDVAETLTEIMNNRKPSKIEVIYLTQL